MDIEGNKDSNGHEKQGKAEYRIEFAYQFIYGKKCGYHVICEYHHDPEHLVKTVGRKHGQKIGRIVNEHCAYKNHKQQGKNPHHSLNAIT